MLSKIISPVITIVLMVFTPVCAPAANLYSFDCRDSKIQGTIKYAVIGNYHAAFDSCKGTIGYDPSQKRVEFVHLQIKVRSVHSQCPWCDKMVLSRRLLNPSVYPFIVFKSNDFQRVTSHRYIVRGTVDMHGIARPVKSEFNLKQGPGGDLYLRGDWVLDRKDFNIVWNRMLDHGGILVGENMTVNWQVKAHREK